MKKLLRVSEAAKILNVSPSTLRMWLREGKIRGIKIGSRWKIPQSEIMRLISGKFGEIKVAIYARVATKKQQREGLLDLQVERLRQYCAARGYRIVAVITDVASELDKDRPGIKRLFDLVEGKEIDVVVIESESRLSRFCFEYLERYFNSHGVKIEVFEELREGYTEESIEEFVTILLDFAARIYGRRSRKYKRIKQFIRSEILSS